MRETADDRGSAALDRSIWALAAVLVVIRLFLIDWNRAEFTDSIIQLQLFQNRNGYFPPVYPALAWLFRIPLGDPIHAGRVVSILAASLVIPVIYRFGRELGGPRAGLWATFIYAVSPVPWRWSLHAMGDSLFTFLFTLSLYLSATRWTGPTQQNNTPCAALGVLVGGLATLTRYQGFILLPIGLAAWWFSPGRRWKHIFPALLPWLAVVFWMRFWGFVHTGQFTGRAAADSVTTLKVYTWIGFSFLRYAPVAFGWTVCVFFLAGLLREVRKPGPGRRLGLVFLVFLVVWLAVHAAFQSFQYRYLLPIVPFLCIFAALGVEHLNHSVRSRVVIAAIFVFFAAELGLSTVRVLRGTRNTFADFPDAAGFISEEVMEREVYSNEVWNPGYLAPKMRFWSGRDVGYGLLTPGPGGAPHVQAGHSNESGGIDLEPVTGRGPVVFCWHNVYAPDQAGWVENLESQPGVRVLFRTPVYENTPYLPDIMVDPPITSWPQAMEYRHRPQRYYTVVFEIDTGDG